MDTEPKPAPEELLTAEAAAQSTADTSVTIKVSDQSATVWVTENEIAQFQAESSDLAQAEIERLQARLAKLTAAVQEVQSTAGSPDEPLAQATNGASEPAAAPAAPAAAIAESAVPAEPPAPPPPAWLGPVFHELDRLVAEAVASRNGQGHV